MHSIRTLLCSCLVLITTQLNAAPSNIWKIDGENGSAVYLVSSVRALPDAAYPLPQIYQTAYTDSEVLLFETNLKYLQDLEMQSIIGIEASYPQGETTLKAEIAPELYKRLGRLMAEMGVPMFTLNDKKPWMAGVLSEMAVMADRGYWPEKSVDKVFYARAKDDGKTIRHLTTAEEFVAPLLDMSPAQSEQMLSLILDDLARFRGDEQSAVEFWESGNADGLARYIEKQNSAYPELAETLLAPRNQQWLKAIQAQLESGKTVMVIADAISILGPNGLLAMLRAEGLGVMPVGE